MYIPIILNCKIVNVSIKLVNYVIVLNDILFFDIIWQDTKMA